MSVIEHIPRPHDLTTPENEIHDVELICSGCGGVQLHPIGVTIEHAAYEGMQVIVDEEGLHVDPTASKGINEPTGRGVIIELLYCCEECPTLTAHTYWFHKGTTYWRTRRTYMDGYDENNPHPISTIWRD